LSPARPPGARPLALPVARRDAPSPTRSRVSDLEPATVTAGDSTPHWQEARNHARGLWHGRASASDAQTQGRTPLAAAAAATPPPSPSGRQWRSGLTGEAKCSSSSRPLQVAIPHRSTEARARRKLGSSMSVTRFCSSPRSRRLLRFTARPSAMLPPIGPIGSEQRFQPSDWF
jgi:hypothetical protein